MKTPFKINARREVPRREAYPLPGNREDDRPDRDELVKIGEVDIVPDGDFDPRDGYSAFLVDADGVAVAWYSGCGTHQLTITESFARFLRGEPAQPDTPPPSAP